MLARAQAGDRHAREEFIRRNSRLAAKVSSRFQTLDKDDAFQEALIALNRAIDGYDPDTGNTFSTYAVAAMTHAVGRQIVKESTIKRGSGQVPMSLDEHLEGGDTLANHLGAEDPDLQGIVDEDAVEYAIARLDRTQREVVERIYGLHGRTAQKLREIAADMGYKSHQRVDQIHKKALDRMRSVLGVVEGS